jgi:hemoglobin
MSEDGAHRTLYDRIGGEEAIESVLFDFYRRVFADPELAPFFENVDAERLHRMQREFFSAALDGPIQYTGRPLREVHADLGIQPRHLRRFVDHLMETLVDRGLEEPDRLAVCSEIDTYADEITGRAGISG